MTEKYWELSNCTIIVAPKELVALTKSSGRNFIELELLRCRNARVWLLMEHDKIDKCIARLNELNETIGNFPPFKEGKTND